MCMSTWRAVRAGNAFWVSGAGNALPDIRFSLWVMMWVRVYKYRKQMCVCVCVFAEHTCKQSACNLVQKKKQKWACLLCFCSSPLARFYCNHQWNAALMVWKRLQWPASLADVTVWIRSWDQSCVTWWSSQTRYRPLTNTSCCTQQHGRPSNYLWTHTQYWTLHGETLWTQACSYTQVCTHRNTPSCAAAASKNILCY